MNRTISITIAGYLFHIEEEGYNTLTAYLKEVHKYFASFADSREITNDIEARIAELFQGFQTGEKQTISLEEVNKVISTIGTPKDFAGLEEAEAENNGFQNEQSSSNNSSSYQSSGNVFTEKGLFRDENRQMIGGVAAGLANYIKIDPLWIRLVLVLGFFGLYFVPAFPSIIFLGYIGLWIAMPGSKNLSEPAGVKKLYRHNKKIVLGGVASGIAAYFGIEIALVRILFLFIPPLWLLYFILWLITPQASSLKEEMEMTGTPFNLSNIEKALGVDENNKEPNVFTRIILLPFKLLSALVKALGPIAVAITKVISVLIGLFLLILGLTLFTSVVAVALAYFGVIEASSIIHIGEDFPINQVIQDIPNLLVYGAIAAVLVPTILLIVGSLNLVFRKLLVKGSLVASLVVIWVLSSIFTIIGLISYFEQFQKTGEVKDKIAFAQDTTQVLEIKLDDRYLDNSWNEVNVKIKPVRKSEAADSSAKKDFFVEIFKSSHGKSRELAKEQAKTIDYAVVYGNNELKVPQYFKLNGKYAGQEAYVKIQIPEGVKFRIDATYHEMWRLIDDLDVTFNFSFDEKPVLYFKDGKLRCDECEQREAQEQNESEEDTNEDSEI